MDILHSLEFQIYNNSGVRFVEEKTHFTRKMNNMRNREKEEEKREKVKQLKPH